MNEVRLNGVLGTVTECSDSVGQFLTAKLHFSRKADTVLLVIIGAKPRRAFAKYDAGDSVSIGGRIATLNGNLVIFLDEVAPWNRKQSLPDASPAKPAESSSGDRQSRALAPRLCS